MVYSICESDSFARAPGCVEFACRFSAACLYCTITPSRSILAVEPPLPPSPIRLGSFYADRSGLFCCILVRCWRGGTRGEEMKSRLEPSINYWCWMKLEWDLRNLLCMVVLGTGYCVRRVERCWWVESYSLELFLSWSMNITKLLSPFLYKSIVAFTYDDALTCGT